MLHFASLEKWDLGVNTVNADNTTPAGGFVMEMLLTMLLVLVVFASAVDSGNNSSPMLPPLLIGLTVTVAHLLLIPFTGELWLSLCIVFLLHIGCLGTSINPARSFGPALIKNQWEHHWVFWVGPLLGGALGGGLYKLVFFNKKDDY